MNNNELSPFARWHGHEKLLGKEFVEHFSGQKISRFHLYLKYQKSPADLEALKNNTHKLYYQVDKLGWKDGFRIENM